MVVYERVKSAPSAHALQRAWRSWCACRPCLRRARRAASTSNAYGAQPVLKPSAFNMAKVLQQLTPIVEHTSGIPAILSLLTQGRILSRHDATISRRRQRVGNQERI